MGIAQSDLTEKMNQETFELLNSFPAGLDERKAYQHLGMVGCCIFDWNDPDKAMVKERIATGQLTPAQRRGLG